MQGAKQKIQTVLIIILALLLHVPSAAAEPNAEVSIPELPIIRTAYSAVIFSVDWDEELDDWRLTVESEGRVSTLYYAGGRFLKREALAEKEKYRRLIYPFRHEPSDPKTMPAEEIERFARFGSTENRSSAPVSSPDFFDAVYDIATRESVESNLASLTFLGQTLRVHHLIVPDLRRVEEKIRSLIPENKAAVDFVNQLASGEAYQWRRIRDTGGMSFHSMGLAIDLLPQNWRSKTIYWLWEKNSGNREWMMIPLDERWMPPEEVIDAFESEGFIWGGKWPIWDNMHFEYRPELLTARDRGFWK